MFHTYRKTDECNDFNSSFDEVRTGEKIRQFSWENNADCEQRVQESEVDTALAKTVGFTRITPQRQMLYSFSFACFKMTHFLYVCFATFEM